MLWVAIPLKLFPQQGFCWLMILALTALASTKHSNSPSGVIWQGCFWRLFSLDITMVVFIVVHPRERQPASVSSSWILGSCFRMAREVMPHMHNRSSACAWVEILWIQMGLWKQSQYILYTYIYTAANILANSSVIWRHELRFPSHINWNCMRVHY